MIVEELYDALIEAGASQEKARAASRAIADMQGHFTNIQRDISHLDQRSQNSDLKLMRILDYTIGCSGQFSLFSLQFSSKSSAVSPIPVL
jgi:hypothetical protein